MQIISNSTLNSDPYAAVDELLAALPSDTPPSLAILSGNYRIFSEDAFEPLSQACPTLVAGSSCQGIMTQTGVKQSENGGLGLFALYDEDGAYGVGTAALEDDPKKAGHDALESALEDAGRSWETPDLIWCILPPGREEAVIEGMVELIGKSVPIIGGSVADNEIAGDWFQYVAGKLHCDCIVVAVLFPSGSIGYSFSSGYTPENISAVVTHAEGRYLLALDGKPAADVYNEWTQGLLNDVPEGGSVLMQSTVSPLGCLVSETEGCSEYLLSHPAELSPQRGLQLFTEVSEGERLHLMRGNLDSLISRAGRVVETAKQLLPDKHTPKGALIVYCAGCMLTVADHMPEVVNSIGSEFEQPFLGTFTFGEQGCFLDSTNRHGNLMISAVVFGAEE